jgi:hypothetical protein
MPIRKHKGINQKTGKLKKGYKYSGKKLKSGLKEIVKVKSQVGGVKFREKVTVKLIPENDCPYERRMRLHRFYDEEGVKQKLWKCDNDQEEYTTENGFPCCKRKGSHFNVSRSGEPVVKLKQFRKLKGPKPKLVTRRVGKFKVQKIEY